MSLPKVEDELGRPVFVGAGDPAYPHIQKLHSRNYSWIVLPREFLFGMASIESLDWKGFLIVAREIGYNTEGGRRSLRLAECIHVLQEKPNGSRRV